jgi:hypothetical protein
MRRRTKAIVILLSMIATGLAVVVGLLIYARLSTGQWQTPQGALIEVKQKIAGPEPEGPPKIIYLHRVGITLTGGDDDAARNRSSIVASFGKTSAKLPAFSGTAKQWKAIVDCVKTKFARFDVLVTEERPAGGNYILVAVGGTPKDLGVAKEVGGLAPFNGEVIPRAVVLAFAKKLSNRTRETCDVIGMEVAHAYGLDHGYDCKDIMTYKAYCGTKQFLDKDIPCGEHKKRACTGGKPTQNSYRMLLAVLGAAKPSTAAAPVQ